MDPYLEAHWGDVHHRLVQYACDALQPRLPRDLRARVEERVFVQCYDEGDQAVFPDVRVVERPRRSAEPSDATGDVALAEPVVIHVADEPVTEGYIEIREVGSEGRVITVVEFLSAANKYAGDGRDLYRQKQKELRQAGVSLVEIDLLRRGPHVLVVPKESIPKSHRTTYQVCVRRGWSPGKVEIYAVPLRQRLPAIAVPLRETDRDVPLELQSLVELCYRNGGYDDIDYSTEPAPPLREEDADWADALLRKAGVRSG
jgi:hypothetical protein